MSKATLIRTCVLAIALLNQLLVAFGWSPLPFEDAEIELALSSLFTAIIAIITWWKNNSITKEAIQADEYMRELKSKR